MHIPSRLTLILCLLLIPGAVLLAQTKVDSLVRRYESEKDPLQKSILATKIASLYQYSDKGKGMYYARLGISQGQRMHNDSVAGNGLSVLGNLYYLNGKFDSARSCYEEARLLCHKAGVRLSEATAINNIGLTYINQGHYSEGLKYQLQSLAIYDSIGNEQGAGRAYNAIAVVYIELGAITHDTDNYRNALIYLRKSLGLSQKTQDKVGYNYMLVNIGNVYKDIGLYDSALYYFKESGKRSAAINDAAAYSTSLGNTAETYFLLGNYDDAIINAELALAGKKNNDDLLGMASANLILAQAYSKTGKEQKAYDCATRAFALADKAGVLKEKTFAARELARLEAGRGNYKAAWNMMDEYARLHDSLTSIENQQLTQELRRFTDEDQKKQIELLTQQNLIAGLKSERQSQLLLFIAIGAALLLILAGLTYSRFLVKKRANLDLQKAYSTIEEKNKSITDSIRYAKNLQEAILPSPEQVQRLLPRHFILYQPKDIVAGDFYWAEESQGLVFFAAADCTGHGVPGALVSVVCARALREALFRHGLHDPGAILDKATELVLETFDRRGSDVNDGMDISLACWNPATHELRWAGANNPLVIFDSGNLLLLPPDKQPVGRSHTRKPFTTHSLRPAAGSSAWLFTDGYADQFGGPEGKKFRKKQLLGFLSSIAQEEPERQKELLGQKFQDWKGSLEQVDDLLVFGVKF